MLEILYLLLAAVILVPLAQRLGIGSVIGYLLAGLLVGPAVLGLISRVDEIRHLAEIGVVFLLFVIGLELKPERLWTMRRHVFGLGVAQVLISGVALSALAMSFGLGPRPAIVVGLGLALSSTAFVVQLLAERHELGSHQGRASFGVLLLQDLAVVPLLAMVAVFAPRAGTVSANLGLALAEGVSALLMVIFVGRYAVRPLLRHIAASGNSEIFAASALLLALGTGWLMEQVGLSMALGAFLAGVLLSDSEFRHQITADIEHFRGLLLGLFFMAVGMVIDLSLLLSQPGTVLLLVLLLVTVKAVVLYPTARIFGLSRPEALRTSLYLTQAGEFGFVLFGTALENKLLNSAEFNLLTLAIAMSMLTTPLMFALAQRLARRMPTTAVPAHLRAEHSQGAQGGVLIAGFGRFGNRVGKVLQQSGIPFVAVDNSPQRVLKAREEGLPVYYGDATRRDVLHHLGANEARLAVVTLDDTAAASRTIRSLRMHCPKVPIYARSRSGEDSRAFYAEGVEVTVPEALESSLQLAAKVLGKLGVEEQQVAEVVSHFRAADYQQLSRDGLHAPAAEKRFPRRK